MNTPAKTTLLAFSLISMLAAPFADAARMGGGRSVGMRRAAPTAPIRPPVQQAIPQAAPQVQKKGVGVGTAIGAGVAGAAAGYMIGSAMNSAPPKTASAPAATHAAAASAPTAASAPAAGYQVGIPWNLVAIMTLIFVVGLLWFRRRVGMPNGAPPSANPQNQQNRQAGQTFDNNQFDPIPSIGSGFPGSNTGFQPSVSSIRRLPDGTETPYFLRQAKATFLHLQSLNSPDSVDEVRRYMTPELFEELRGDIWHNGEIADFAQLDCQLLDASEENGRYLASVSYTGQVSESVNAALQPFSETWHFIKDVSAGSSGKWVVSGIQQNN